MITRSEAGHARDRCFEGTACLYIGVPHLAASNEPGATHSPSYWPVRISIAAVSGAWKSVPPPQKNSAKSIS